MNEEAAADEVQRLCDLFQTGNLQTKLKAVVAVRKMADDGFYGACLVTGQALLGRGWMGGLLDPDPAAARPYLEKALGSPSAMDRACARAEMEQSFGPESGSP